MESGSTVRIHGYLQLAGMRAGSRRCDSRIMLQCLIVDDSPPFIQAARGLLERQGITVVGTASTGDDALQQAQRLRPDVTLVDIDLGGESGFDVVRRLRREADLARMILISTHAEQDYADLIAASPAAGFLSKSTLSADAIRGLLETGTDGDSAGSVSGPGGR
ncbi:MAG: putative transcriptional regulator [Modestobacter sp.]|jgi:DNA-binding NarL/FixJ family response regulator|nr:putative transcriptional regulator [Modestobacter sp.]